MLKATCSYLKNLTYNVLITPLVYPSIPIFLEICVRFCVKIPSLAHMVGVNGEGKDQMRTDHLKVGIP